MIKIENIKITLPKWEWWQYGLIGAMIVITFKSKNFDVTYVVDWFMDFLTK